MKKKIIIIMITIMVIIVGMPKTYAKTITITSQTYSIRHIQQNTGSEIWTSYVNNGTQTQINTDTYWTQGFRTKFYSENKFQANTQYQAKVRLNTTPKMTYNTAEPRWEFTCYGSISNSNYNAQTQLISGCQLVSIEIESGNNFTDYYINFTPTTNIETVQFVILWYDEKPITRLNIDNTSKITYDTSTQDALNSQTESLINNNNSNTNTIIENNNNNTTSIINNQNSNTQDIIENAKNNLYSNCSKGYRYFLIGSDKSYIQSSTNNVNNNNNYFITQPIRLYPNESYTLNIVNATNIQNGYYCFFNKNKERISCTKYSNNTTTSYTFTTPANTYFATFTLYRSNEVMLNATIKGNTCVLDTYETDVKNFRNTQELNNTINQGHNYNNNASETIQGQQDIDNMQNKENEIMNNIDLSGTEELNVSINSNTSNFIWAIAQRLREMNEKIVLLFTSLLGLGVMKTILNR